MLVGYFIDSGVGGRGKVFEGAQVSVLLSNESNNAIAHAWKNLSLEKVSGIERSLPLRSLACAKL